MNRIYSLIVAVFIMVPALFAQEIEFKKEDFRVADNYKIAKKYVKEGDEQYEMGAGRFPNALDNYLKAYKLNSKNAALNYKIGKCYLHSIARTSSVEYLLSAYKLDPGVMDDILLLIGRGYHYSLDFDNAITYYKRYKSQLPPSDAQVLRPKIDKLIRECETGIELVKNPVRVFIDNCGPNINSTFADYSPLISADESMMIFTSKRGEDGDPMLEDGYYFENIYISYSNNGGKDWTKAQRMEKPLNEKDENNATVGLSPDGQQLFVFTGQNGGDILISELKGDEWSKPDDKLTKKYVNSELHESSASFSFDGRTMYFDSNQDASPEDLKTASRLVDVPHNLFYTNWDNDKERWDMPKNLSNTINTEYDERGVFMHPDGRTIYFSSKGHKGMGGFDIFKSELQDDGTWSDPENLGYPINTPDDDVFFVMAANGKHGYYASQSEGGIGSYDIYRITFRGPEKPITQSNEDNLLANTEPVSEVIMEEGVEIKTMRLTILKGTVKDALDLKPLEATIEIFDNDKNEVVSVMNSNSATGKFLVSLPSGKNYGIAVRVPDYLFHSENFNIPEATGYQEVTKDILMNKMEVGKKIILKNIFFDYAKATLRSASHAELDRLYDLLAKYPSTRIEIGGHTDSHGDDNYNQKLSQDRAQSVVSYLISKGIDKSRLEAKGYGEKEPIDTNDTDDGRQNNRRVEFKVLSN